MFRLYPPMLLGLVAALVSGSDAVAQSTLRLSAAAAWEGLVRPDAASEIRLLLAADEAATVQVQVTETDGHLNRSQRQVVELSADNQKELRIPIRASAGSSLSVLAQADFAETVQKIDLQVVPRSDRVIVVLGDAELAAVPADWMVIYPSIATLPQLTTSYETIDLLLVDESALMRLTELQQTALEGYTAGCGRVVVRGDSSIAGLFKRNAGCAGRFVVHAGVASDLRAIVRNLADLQTDSLPSNASLMAMLATQNGGAGQFVAFVGGYMVLMILGFQIQMKPTLLLLMPVAVSVISLIAWTQMSGSQHWVQWTEFEVDDAAARYVGILRVQGGRRGLTELDIPVGLGLPRALRSEEIVITHRPESEQISMQFASLLNQVNEFSFSGAAPAVTPLGMAIVESRPLISNRTARQSPAGTLSWRGDKFPVPQLEPGETWQPGEQSEPWESDEVERTFRARALTDTSALLIDRQVVSGLLGFPGRDLLVLRLP